MKFILKDRNRFFLANTNNRFMHLATIHYGIREFMYFIDKIAEKTYIEEITGGTLSYIEDISLWNALAQFILDKKLNYIVEHRC